MPLVQTVSNISSEVSHHTSIRCNFLSVMMMKHEKETDLKNQFQDDSDDDGEDGDEDDSDDDEDESDDEEEEEDEESKMDTSAGSTPFKKQKGDKKQNKENGASPKKDKPKDNKVQCKHKSFDTRVSAIDCMIMQFGYRNMIIVLGTA